MSDGNDQGGLPPWLHVERAKIVERYLKWVESCEPKKARDYRSRPPEQLSSITAEAVVWEHLVRSFECKVDIADSQGGPDFRCSKDGYIFFVEVKALENGALSKRTGLPNGYEQGARMFSLDNIKGRGLIEEYEHQLKIGDHPVVLALCSDHARANLVFGELGVRSMMFGTLGFTMGIGSGGQDVRDSADFESSFWLDPKPTGELGVFRDFPSAVLLVCIREVDATFAGLLHPSPKIAFDYRTFAKVPFCRFTTWPPQEYLELEWVVHRPASMALSYHIDLSESGT